MPFTPEQQAWLHGLIPEASKTSTTSDESGDGSDEDSEELPAMTGAEGMSGNAAGYSANMDNFGSKSDNGYHDAYAYSNSVSTESSSEDSAAYSDESESEGDSESEEVTEKQPFSTESGEGGEPESKAKVGADDPGSVPEKILGKARKLMIKERKPVADPAQTGSDAPNLTGMKGTSVGDEYAGEHNMAGWRTDGPKKTDNRLKTKLYSDEERAEKTLVMKDDKSFALGSGQEMQGQTVGYVMDPKTGEMVMFKDGANKFAKYGDEEYRTTVKDSDRNTGTLLSQLENDKASDIRFETTHHSSPLGGDVEVDKDGKPKLDKYGDPIMKSREVASAGFVKFDAGGKIANISNSSGHYKPSVTDLLQAVEYLSVAGAFLETDITDATGKQLRDKHAGFKLYQSVREKKKSVPGLVARAEDLIKALQDPGQDEKALAEYNEEFKDLIEQIGILTDALETAEDTLRKLGVGPSQKMNEDAVVTYKDAKPTLGGQQFREAPDTVAKVEQFLRTGGNNISAMIAKGDLLDEFKKNVELKEPIEEAATPKRKGPTKRDVENALAQLEGKPLPK